MSLNQITNRLTMALFIVYLMALYWILLFKLGVQFSYGERRSVNLIPFNQLLFLNGKSDVREMILNVIIFVPLGIYSAILFYEWNFGRKIFFLFLMTLIVEGLQFAFAVGAFDATDITTNTFGGITGLMIYKGFEKVFNNRIKAQKLINIVAGVGTILVILLLSLLKLNMLPVRYQ